MSSYVEKHFNTVRVKHFFRRSVSVFRFLKPSPADHCCTSWETVYLHKSSGTLGMKDPLFGKFSSIAQRTGWRREKPARISVLLIYIVLPTRRGSVAMCASRGPAASAWRVAESEPWKSPFKRMLCVTTSDTSHLRRCVQRWSEEPFPRELPVQLECLTGLCGAVTTAPPQRQLDSSKKPRLNTQINVSGVQPSRWQLSFPKCVRSTALC